MLQLGPPGQVIGQRMGPAKVEQDELNEGEESDGLVDLEGPLPPPVGGGSEGYSVGSKLRTQWAC